MAARDVANLVRLAAPWGAASCLRGSPCPSSARWRSSWYVAVAAVVLTGLMAWRGGLRGLIQRSATGRPRRDNTAVPFTLFAFATVTLPAGLASVLNATVPLFGAVTGAVWLGDRLSAARGVDC